MTYHKRPVQTRTCAHCRIKFDSNHKRRLYCSNSCNTLACRARKGGGAATGRAGAARPAGGDLPFSAHTVGVVAAGSALGTVAAQAGTYVAQQLWQGGSDAQLLRADMQAQFAALRADLGLPAEAAPASFVPAAVRAATGPVRHLGPKGGPLAPFVAVRYHGHVLYYCAATDVLLYSSAPNTFQRVSGTPMLAALAATPPPHRLEPVRLAPDAAAPQLLSLPDRAAWDAAAWDAAAWAADVRAADAQEAAAMAAFARALAEGEE